MLTCRIIVLPYDGSHSEQMRLVLACRCYSRIFFSIIPESVNFIINREVHHEVACPIGQNTKRTLGPETALPRSRSQHLLLHKQRLLHFMHKYTHVFLTVPFAIPVFQNTHAHILPLLLCLLYLPKPLLQQQQKVTSPCPVVPHNAHNAHMHLLLHLPSPVMPAVRTKPLRHATPRHSKKTCGGF